MQQILAAFSYIVCHEHSNKAFVDFDLIGNNGYVYSGTSFLLVIPESKK